MRGPVKPGLLTSQTRAVNLPVDWTKKFNMHSLPHPGHICFFIDTEYDRAKVPPYNGNDPPPAPGSLKALLFPPLLNEVQNKGTQGVHSEVPRGNPSIHFHCPVPRSSSHIGHGFWFLPIHQVWRVPNPPGANPLVAERALWRSSHSCVTGGQQPIIGNPCRFLSFCTPGNPCATP